MEPQYFTDHVVLFLSLESLSENVLLRLFVPLGLFNLQPYFQEWAQK